MVIDYRAPLQEWNNVQSHLRGMFFGGVKPSRSLRWGKQHGSPLLQSHSEIKGKKKMMKERQYMKIQILIGYDAWFRTFHTLVATFQHYA